MSFACNQCVRMELFEKTTIERVLNLTGGHLGIKKAGDALSKGKSDDG